MICAGIRADPKVVKKIVKLISRFFLGKCKIQLINLLKLNMTRYFGLCQSRVSNFPFSSNYICRVGDLELSYFRHNFFFWLTLLWAQNKVYLLICKWNNSLNLKYFSCLTNEYTHRDVLNTILYVFLIMPERTCNF